MNVRIFHIKSGRNKNPANVGFGEKIYTGNNIDDESPAWCMWGGV